MVLAVALALGVAADAGAESRGQNPQKAPPAQEVPLQIYLAKGEPHACGEGCSEWIAVEGWFDRDAAGRVHAFLKRHGARKLPVYFHSPGGNAAAAFAIGRQLRQLGLTTGAGTTIPRGCASASDRSAACHAAKRSAQPVAAVWRPDATCNSACVFALLGGKVRQVPPSGRLGVHSAKLTLTRVFSDGRVQQVSSKQMPSVHKAKAAEFNVLTRRYIGEMGVDEALMETALKVPHEDIHFLSRDEIAAYGIDRREYAETSWFITQLANNTFHVSKWIVEARGPHRKDYRVSAVLIACAKAQRATVLYLRGLASDEVGRPVTATLSIGSHKAVFSLTGSGTRQDAVDTGVLFSSSLNEVPFDEFAAAAAAGAVTVVETDPLAAMKRPRDTRLSTHGLAEGIKLLRDKCAQPVPSWADGARVPFVPTQAGTQNPWLPAGVYLRPGGGRE
jgi:hypothetical protein